MNHDPDIHATVIDVSPDTLEKGNTSRRRSAARTAVAVPALMVIIVLELWAIGRPPRFDGVNPTRTTAIVKSEPIPTPETGAVPDSGSVTPMAGPNPERSPVPELPAPVSVDVRPIVPPRFPAEPPAEPDAAESTPGTRLARHPNSAAPQANVLEALDILRTVR